MCVFDYFDFLSLEPSATRPFKIHHFLDAFWDTQNGGQNWHQGNATFETFQIDHFSTIQQSEVRSTSLTFNLIIQHSLTM